MSSSVISIEYRGRVAVITIANEKKLGAMTQAQYFELSQALREVAKHDEVFVTVLLGKGRFFSAYVTLLQCNLSFSYLFKRLLLLLYMFLYYDVKSHHEWK